jgi:uncharacterized repeat protein (TIGR03803 family)
MRVFTLCATIVLTTGYSTAQTAYKETILHSFGDTLVPFGGAPEAVVRDHAGNLYGVAYSGGSWGEGTAFKLDSSGHITVLHTFTGGADGANPNSLIIDEAGNLFGTTEAGGNACTDTEGSCGVVFQIDPTGHETVLYSFSGPDGELPNSALTRDSAGNLYGTTSFGGTADFGVVFKLDTAGHETVIYSFGGGEDGAVPTGGVLLNSGYLYGTTECGGLGGNGCSGSPGVVYKLDASGHETVLYSFTGGNDGGAPYSGVVMDPEGNLYGTTTQGGPVDKGVVFMLTSSGQETVLHTFAGGSDGGDPFGNLVRDGDGNLFGTTVDGTVFKIDPSGQETVIHHFTGADGKEPGAIFMDTAGLFGGTISGGAENMGVIYRIAAGQESTLYSFPGRSDGVNPEAGVTMDSAGNLYGTTNRFGRGYGSVFKLDPAGRETVLHVFAGGKDGSSPIAGVVLDSAGNIYGTTTSGGLPGYGIVYKLDSSGAETILHTFAGGTDGFLPTGGVTLDSAGNLYGTTTAGGTADAGILFKLDPTGKETILHTFTGGFDGAQPKGNVTFDSAGNLYGTTSIGGVYKFDTAGNFTVLHTFAGGPAGYDLEAGVTLDSSGNIYGTAYAGGGTNGCCGVVFKLSPSGALTVLHNFTGPDGSGPLAGVVFDTAGNLYGTTQVGGANNLGVVYKIDTSGKESTIYSFEGPPRGKEPYGGVIPDSSGNLYGTTYKGGKQAAGTVFKLAPE